METKSIPVTAIDPPLFNSRLLESVGTPAELDSLGASLKTDQQSPIRVVSINGGSRFRLVYGSRRLAAAKHVGMDTITAVVLPTATEADEILGNGIENVQRKDLTTFEQARLCDKLRELKLSNKEVAAKLGMSPQHVSNLAICYASLPTEVLQAWEKGAPATDMNFLRSIVTKDVGGKKVTATHEDMRAAYYERVAALTEIEGEEEDDEDEDDEDGGKGETAGAPAPKKYSVHKDRYRATLKALRGARSPQIAVDACRYLVGEIERVRGLNLGDEKAPTKKTTKKGEE